MATVNCSWCATEADRQRWAALAKAGAPVSHGLCATCHQKMLAELEQYEAAATDPRRC